MAFDLGNLLNQYLGGAAANQQQAHDDFDRVAQNAPQDVLARGVTGALRSDQTPPFPQMVSQMFGQSDPHQRAGMLNQLLTTLGPAVLAQLGSGGLGGLGNLFGGRTPTQVTPEQASQVSPEQVRELAEKAEQENPSIVDRMGDFYAQNPTLVKAIGGAALAIALGHMAQNMRRH
ncbi:hypothetical protein [Massilia sp. 9I]|uniref:hypothetical protein n=1 Tax=Massilia sp. 9I TaxID=2653152 RepID=UPI0012F1A987|nr:hypothetical protein [Massilia sp. 9I]VXB28401.1 conserved hypothetical protein [Massilia sp. 9I]